MSVGATVFVVDDDAAVRDALTHLLAAGGYAVEGYASAEAFLAACDPDRPGCVVLDIQMPGMSGLELQTALAERHLPQPIIFLTSHGTINMAVQACKQGAFDFLQKPAEGSALLARVHAALQADAERRRKEAVRSTLVARCAVLTAREHEIFPLVAAGRSSKDIARRLGISHRTVELHRARIMHKLNVHTLVELAAVAEACGCASPALPEDAGNLPEGE